MESVLICIHLTISLPVSTLSNDMLPLFLVNQVQPHCPALPATVHHPLLCTVSSHCVSEMLLLPQPILMDWIPAKNQAAHSICK